jgi:hypothetical protein
MRVRDLVTTCTATYGRLPTIYKMRYGEYVDISTEKGWADELVDAWRVGNVRGTATLLIWVK